MPKCPECGSKNVQVVENAISCNSCGHDEFNIDQDVAGFFSVEVNNLVEELFISIRAEKVITPINIW